MMQSPRNVIPLSIRLALGVLVLACLPGWLRAAGETEIAPGDVLRIEVLNAPEFSREARVDADGRIALPQLGMIAVAGDDLTAARSKIEEALKTSGPLAEAEILLEMAAYRPIYVSGSVGHPGAVTFIPGLTARQAVIAAGGLKPYGAEAGAFGDLALETLTARRAAAFQIAQISARIARIETELAGAAALASALPEDLRGTQAAADEQALLYERRQSAASRAAHAEALLGLFALEVETLDQQADLQQTEADIQKSEIADARQLVEQGLMPRPRLQEMLRDQSQMSRDQLENRAFAARAKQGAATVEFEFAEEAAAEREQLRRDLFEARAQHAQLLAEIETLDIRLVTAGTALDMAGRDAPEPTLTVHRTQKGTVQHFAAKPDAYLRPGDVLEVTLDLPRPEARVAGE